MAPPIMTPRQVYERVVLRTYAEILPGKFASPEASVQLLAIMQQESGLQYRQQIGGPARGLAQFEKGGGVAAVLSHGASRRHALAVCALRGVTPTAESVYARLHEDDLLACAFARLLLYTDPAPLPALGHVSEGWALYLRTWRPGKPRQPTWAIHYAQALEAVQ